MQDGTQAMVQQPAQIAQGQQVIQLASSSLATQQPAAITTTASNAATSSATQQAASVSQQQQAGSGGNQNIIMMVPGATGGSPTIQRIPLPGKIFTFSIEFSHEKQLFKSTPKIRENTLCKLSTKTQAVISRIFRKQSLRKYSLGKKFVKTLC